MPARADGAVDVSTGRGRPDGVGSERQRTQLARQQYADQGVDTDAALAPAREGADLAALLAGRRCGWDSRTWARRWAAASPRRAIIPAGRARPDELRADATKALSLIPGHASLQPARLLRRVRRQARRSRRDRAGAFRRLDRVGEVARHRPRLQSDVLLASQGRRQLHPGAAPTAASAPSGSSHGIACRRIGAAMGEALGTTVRDQPLDSRRHEGHAGRPGRAARAADRLARRDLRRPDRPGAQPRRARGQAVRLGIESYTVGSHEFYFGYALSPQAALHARHRALPSRPRRSPTRSAR